VTGYSAILFDVDDTLLDFRASEAEACRAVAGLYAAAGVPPDAFISAFRNANDAVWDLYMEKRITRAQVADQTFESLKQLLPGSERIDTHAAAMAFNAAFADRSVVEPDATRVLASLHTRYVTGVISNHEQPAIQRRRLAVSGLAQLLDVVVISGDIGVEKPDPHIFDHALQLMGMTARQCLFVGDSIMIDDAGTRSAGMDFCWYRRHHAAPFAPTTAVKVIESLTELDALLDAPNPLVRHTAG
jgi:HAD superfamily hydrolase (TIGR01549 family)